MPWSITNTYWMVLLHPTAGLPCACSAAPAATPQEAAHAERSVSAAPGAPVGLHSSMATASLRLTPGCGTAIGVLMTRLCTATSGAAAAAAELAVSWVAEAPAFRVRWMVSAIWSASEVLLEASPRCRMRLRRSTMKRSRWESTCTAAR